MRFVQIKYLYCPGEGKEQHARRYEKADIRVPATQARQDHLEVREVCRLRSVPHSSHALGKTSAKKLKLSRLRITSARRASVPAECAGATAAVQRSQRAGGIRSAFKVDRRFSIAGRSIAQVPASRPCPARLSCGGSRQRLQAPLRVPDLLLQRAIEKQLRTHRSERDESQSGKITLVCAQVYTRRVKTKRMRRATRPQITEETVAATRRFDVGPMGHDAQRRTRARFAPSCRPRVAPSFADRQSVCSCSGKERRYKPRVAVAAPPGTRSAARASRARHCNRSHRAQSRQRGKGL